MFFVQKPNLQEGVIWLAYNMQEIVRNMTKVPWNRIISLVLLCFVFFSDGQSACFSWKIAIEIGFGCCFWQVRSGFLLYVFLCHAKLIKQTI